MARFIFEEYYDFATKGYPNAATWEVALDPDFNNIIDRTDKNPDATYEWNSPLEYNNGANAYADLDNVYARVKIWIDDTVSDWFVVEPKNQNNQEVVYTENNTIIKTVNSLDVGFN